MLVSFSPRQHQLVGCGVLQKNHFFHMFSQGCDGPEWEGRERKELPGNSGGRQRDASLLDQNKLDHLTTRDVKTEFRQPHSAILHHYTKSKNTQIFVFKCQNPSPQYHFFPCIHAFSTFCILPWKSEVPRDSCWPLGFIHSWMPWPLYTGSQHIQFLLFCFFCFFAFQY